MKWKSLYKLSKKLAFFVTVPFVVANVMLTLRLEFKRQPNGSFVAVNYVPYSGGACFGAYDTKTDMVTIKYLPDQIVYQTIVHELKHADNEQKFSYNLNTDANELSARLATSIYNLGLDQRLTHARAVIDSVGQSLSESVFRSAMDSLRCERLENNVAWQNAKTEQELDSIYNATIIQLRAERQSMIDSIVQRFDGAVKDSLVRTIEAKYSEQSVGDKELDKLKDMIDSISYDTRRIDKNILERDFNYQLQNLNQHQVDSILSDAMQDYQRMRSSYWFQRYGSLIHTQFHPMNDADLEKLFTYKINGVHRSLFKEASPAIKQRVRQMANGDNLIVRARQILGRE